MPQTSNSTRNEIDLNDLIYKPIHTSIYQIIPYLEQRAAAARAMQTQVGVQKAIGYKIINEINEQIKVLLNIPSNTQS